MPTNSTSAKLDIFAILFPLNEELLIDLRSTPLQYFSTFPETLHKMYNSGPQYRKSPAVHAILTSIFDRSLKECTESALRLAITSLDFSPLPLWQDIFRDFAINFFDQLSFPSDLLTDDCNDLFLKSNHPLRAPLMERYCKLYEAILTTPGTSNQLPFPLKSDDFPEYLVGHFVHQMHTRLLAENHLANIETSLCTIFSLYEEKWHTCDPLDKSLPKLLAYLLETSYFKTCSYEDLLANYLNISKHEPSLCSVLRKRLIQKLPSWLQKTQSIQDLGVAISIFSSDSFKPSHKKQIIHRTKELLWSPAVLSESSPLSLGILFSGDLSNLFFPIFAHHHFPSIKRYSSFIKTWTSRPSFREILSRVTHEDSPYYDEISNHFKSLVGQVSSLKIFIRDLPQYSTHNPSSPLFSSHFCDWMRSCLDNYLASTPCLVDNETCPLLCELLKVLASHPSMQYLLDDLYDYLGDNQ